ncbi:hypothetical protein LEP48_13375 [Isoptericola sp. NEAU-Y5]|uniref:Uncharacterized protein n=1 Tax=Isoptericola luteus TaxID=2879484 RepID=A0ABS7ZH43_9MICO|nr:hypothetical protein [Isoptericola sp. NEAU-Y5]MCA5894332.1 hypothetical protein [Isoptericola sp. NEAU-Y5]
MRRVQWSSVATVVGAGVVALVMLWVAIRGRAWALVPFVLALGVAVREVRHLQRAARPPVGFDETPRGRRRSG